VTVTRTQPPRAAPATSLAALLGATFGAVALGFTRLAPGGLGLALVGLGLAGCRATEAVLVAPPLYNVDTNGVGMHGYDPVSYFPEGGGVPRVGSTDIVARHQGVTYHFVGEATRRRFLGNPERYVPLYGGWSAWAMVDGQRMDVDPTSFLVQDGHLLLFYLGTFSDGRAKWLQREPRELRRQADQAWFALVARESGDGKPHQDPSAAMLRRS